MMRVIVLLVAGLPFVGTLAYAQDRDAKGPGTVEVTVIPGGSIFFTSSDTEPGFGNYDLGGAVAYKINRMVGVEGQVGGTLGITQDLQFGGLTSSERTPNMLAYTGDVVVSGRMRHATIPYVSAGLGGLTMYQRAALGVDNTETFLTGNLGGGVKWYASKRWGLRGDYRFTAVRSADNAPAFFGEDTRHGHRIYGGVTLNVVN